MALERGRDQSGAPLFLIKGGVIIYSRVLHELMGRVARRLRLLDLCWSEELLAEAAHSLVGKKGLSIDVAQRWVDRLPQNFPTGRTEIDDVRAWWARMAIRGDRRDHRRKNVERCQGDAAHTSAGCARESLDACSYRATLPTCRSLRVLAGARDTIERRPSSRSQIWLASTSRGLMGRSGLEIWWSASRSCISPPRLRSSRCRSSTASRQSARTGARRRRLSNCKRAVCWIQT